VNKQPIAASGIVYFSDDNGVSWQNKSQCLPENVFLTDIATSNQWLGVSTKQNGIFMYDFENENWEKTSGKPGTSADTDALFFFKNHLYAGTHNEGIFVSTNNGKNWSAINQGLGKLTIRRFAEIDNRLYVGTNDGLYVFDETKQKWQLEFGNNQLQVNGIIKVDEEIYIGTNQGVFKSPIDQNNWKHVLRDHSLHNISSANKSLYALEYNELYASKDKGASWYNDQRGMPSGKYSFQLLQKGRSVFVGQWDGIYTNDPFENWKLFNNGIPPNTPITEMNTYKSLLVAASPYWVKQR
jgi:ligand-binding sensor domain-containing protein